MDTVGGVMSIMEGQMDTVGGVMSIMHAYGHVNK